MSKGSSANLVLRPADAERVQALLEEALALLGKQPSLSERRPKTKASRPASSERLSYTLNVRAFMRRYGANLGGAARFTLLAARLANGKVGLGVPLKEIEAHWKKMTTVMGPYNPAHSTRAKERGWLDAPKYGVYSLSDHWIGALGKHND
jgi:hypothetical protein